MSNVPKLLTVPNLSSSKTLAVNNALALTKNSAIKSSNQNIPAAIEQKERLYTTRSRAIQNPTSRGEHAYIKLLTSNPADSMARHLSDATGETTSLGGSTSGVLNDAINGTGYASFLLTSTHVSLDEKVQITEVFGDAEVTYFFGRQPIQMEFSGVLIDSPDNDWFTQWLDMYGHVLRGSQLARNYELVKIALPNMTVTGTITRTSFGQDSQRDVDIPFQFTMLVKSLLPKPVGRITAPQTGGVLSNKPVASFVTQSNINSVKANYGGLISVVQNPLSTTKDYSSALMSPGLNKVMSGTSYLGALTPTLAGIPDSGYDTGFNAKTAEMTKAAATPTLGAGKTNGVEGSGIFKNVSSNLTGVRSSLFSPIYGVLSSLTKLVKSVTGSLKSVISSFTNPVKNILRDIRNISSQASGLVQLVNSGIKSATNDIKGLDNDLRSTIASLKKTAGVISSAPKTITQSLRDLVNAGKLPITRGFLQNKSGSSLSIGGLHSNSKLTMLNSGPKHTPLAGARL